MEDYLETYYEIVAGFYSNPDHPKLVEIEETQGRGGMWEYAKELTDKFQEKYKNHFWDGDFYDKIDEFMEYELNLTK